MYAVIRSGGKQYKVAPGKTIEVEKLDGKVGGKVTFDDIVAVRYGRETSSSPATRPPKPRLPARSSAHGRAAKRIVFKFKSCGQYKISRGHRQSYTAVQVSDISLS